MGCALRALLLVAFAIGILAGGLEVARRSDLPRRIVERTLAETTGLDVQVGSLVTTWSGVSTINDVVMTAPLDDEPILSVAEIEVDHTALVPLVVTRSLRIDRLRSRGADVALRESADGRWNVEQLVRSLADPGTAGGAPLPALDIAETTLTATRRDGLTRRLEGIALTASTPSPDSMVRVVIDSVVTIEGRIAHGPGMRHDLRVDLHDPSVLEGWVDGRLVPTAATTCRVLGTVDADGWSGRCEVAGLTTETLRVVGAVHARVAGSSVEARPDTLDVRVAGVPSPIIVEGGTVTLGGGTLVARGVAARTPEASSIVDADVDLAAGVVRLDGRWFGRAETQTALGGLAHAGRLTGSVRLDRAGTIEVDFDGALTVETERGELRTGFHAVGDGASTETIRLALTLPNASWSGAGAFELDGATVTVQRRGNLVELHDFALPTAERVRGRGQLDVGTWAWSADLGVVGLAMPMTPGPVSLEVVARGSVDTVDVERLDIETAAWRAAATGSWHAERDTPLQGHVEATWRPVAEAAPALPLEALALDAEFGGTADPIAIELDGTATAHSLAIGRTTIESVNVPFTGTTDGRTVSIDTQPCAVLGGDWTTLATWTAETGLLAIEVAGRDVALAKVRQALAYPDAVGGALDADLTIEIGRGIAGGPRLVGGWSVRDLSTVQLGTLSGSGLITLSDRVLYLERLQLEQGDATVEGSASYELRDTPRVTFDVTVGSWPIELAPRWSATFDGDAVGWTVVGDAEGAGRADGALVVRRDGTAVATATARGSLAGSEVILEHATGDAFGGRFDASGRVTIGNLHGATAEATWHEVDLAMLGDVIPGLEQLAGRAEGRVVVAPSNDPRALEPTRIDVSGSVVDGFYRDHIAIGPFSATAFAGPTRLVVSESECAVAGGTVSLWGRRTRHGEDTSLHGIARLDDLDVAQITAAFDPGNPPARGLIAGDIRLGGTVGDPSRTFGSATLELTACDLVEVPLFGALYDLLHIGTSRAEPTGRGAANLRISGRRLDIDKMTYFNRGTHIALTGSVDDMFAGGASPISGVGIGSLRPLYGVDVAVVADLDRFLRTWQSKAVAVRIGGTVEERTYESVPLSEVGQTVGRIFRAIGK